MDSAFYVTDQHTVFMFTFEMVLSVCQWLSNYHPYLTNLNFNTLKDRQYLLRYCNRTCLQADHTGDHDALTKEVQSALIGLHFNAHQLVPL